MGEAQVQTQTVLVTGGAGFIGSRLVHALARAGQRVVIADNLSAKRSLDLLAGARCEFFHVDVRCPEDFAALPRVHYDRVYHLAASFANARSVDLPVADWRTNVEGTRHTLDFAREVGCGLFVYAGSSSCYGSLTPPFAEDDAMRPATPYARSKLEGEGLVAASELRCAIFRLFNVYGPGDWPGPYRNAIPNMFFAARQPAPCIELFGEQSTRDFTYVDDVVGVLSRAELGAGATTNIGAGREVAIAALAEKIAALAGAPASCIHTQGLREWDTISRRCADVRRLRARFGGVPDTPLDRGLAQTLAWLDEHALLAAGAP
ncbi:NAD-dependent epimerase/dehydratase family protein [Pseudenhygromyxa sp. WMMC2535]|nr:NAD-dependent epimerase/dehydratase family protein [Pseudenhygromyxa sp. WMMC2535]